MDETLDPLAGAVTGTSESLSNWAGPYVRDSLYPKTWAHLHLSPLPIRALHNST